MFSASALSISPYKLEDFFDTDAAIVPSWAIGIIKQKSMQECERLVYAGVELWKELVFSVMVATAGDLPSGVMTYWRSIIIDGKVHLDHVAQALGLIKMVPQTSGRDCLGLLLEIMARGRQDKEGAKLWLKKLLRPALAIITLQNQQRIAALNPNSRYNGGPRTAAALRTLSAAGDTAYHTALAHRDKPAPLGPMDPGIVGASPPPKLPQKRPRADSPAPTPVAGSSRLPLVLLSSVAPLPSDREDVTGSPPRKRQKNLRETPSPSSILSPIHNTHDHTSLINLSTAADEK
ncbi:hypothetical protein DFH06DRAFT_1320196 [Mycena polygramma]|nr:hypothetical protein DFH06DRAFT_1320196 [Mycena polygramma]